MPTASEILDELKTLGDESTKRTLLRHGAVEPIYGVKIQHLKVIQKRVKKDHQLALELFGTGCSDAMYLASLICDPSKLSKSDLNRWVKTASWPMISDYSVAWAAAESKHGWELALQWITSSKELIISAGWSTLCFLMSIRPDDQLDIVALKKLLLGLPKAMKSAPGKVAYAMNGFLIAAGCYVPELTETAQAVAKKIGKVEVDMGDTSCKVPDATAAIAKVIALGRHGKKRKTAYC
jgi:3-methyladenine DNA glycosylase AlkD